MCSDEFDNQRVSEVSNLTKKRGPKTKGYLQVYYLHTPWLDRRRSILLFLTHLPLQEEANSFYPGAIIPPKFNLSL